MGDDELHESFYGAGWYKDSSTERLARELHEEGERDAAELYGRARFMEPYPPFPPCGCKSKCFERANPHLPPQRECQASERPQIRE